MKIESSFQLAIQTTKRENKRGRRTGDAEESIPQRKLRADLHDQLADDLADLDQLRAHTSSACKANRCRITRSGNTAAWAGNQRRTNSKRRRNRTGGGTRARHPNGTHSRHSQRTNQCCRTGNGSNARHANSTEMGKRDKQARINQPKMSLTSSAVSSV